jgi:microcystin-dependent protein
MESYLGEIMLFGGTYAPQDWRDCDGSLLPINQNQALYALLGTQYGGDGVTSFAIPDLRGQIPVGAGTRPGGYGWNMGQARGARDVTLVQTQLPPHTHSMNLSSAQATSPAIGNGASVPAATAPNLLTYSNRSATVGQPANLSPKMVQPTGGGTSHPNVMPTAYVRYIICTSGLFPSA